MAVCVRPTRDAETPHRGGKHPIAQHAGLGPNALQRTKPQSPTSKATLTRTKRGCYTLEGFLRRALHVTGDQRNPGVTTFAHLNLERNLTQQRHVLTKRGTQRAGHLGASAAAKDLQLAAIGLGQPRHVLDDAGNALPGLHRHHACT